MAKAGMFDVAEAALAAVAAKTEDPPLMIAGLACATITSMAAAGGSPETVKATICAMVDRHYAAMGAAVHGTANELPA